MSDQRRLLPPDFCETHRHTPMGDKDLRNLGVPSEFYPDALPDFYDAIVTECAKYSEDYVKVLNNDSRCQDDDYLPVQPLFDNQFYLDKERDWSQDIESGKKPLRRKKVINSAPAEYTEWMEELKKRKERAAAAAKVPPVSSSTSAPSNDRQVDSIHQPSQTAAVQRAPSQAPIRGNSIPASVSHSIVPNITNFQRGGGNHFFRGRGASVSVRPRMPINVQATGGLQSSIGQQSSAIRVFQPQPHVRVVSSRPNRYIRGFGTRIQDQPPRGQPRSFPADRLSHNVNVQPNSTVPVPTGQLVDIDVSPGHVTIENAPPFLNMTFVSSINIGQPMSSLSSTETSESDSHSAPPMPNLHANIYGGEQQLRENDTVDSTRDQFEQLGNCFARNNYNQ